MYMSTKQSAVKNSFSTYECYAPDGLFWLNLYQFLSYCYLILNILFCRLQQDQIIEKHKVLVAQLQIEVEIERINTSITIKEMIDSVKHDEMEDALVNPRILEMNNPLEKGRKNCRLF